MILVIYRRQKCEIIYRLFLTDNFTFRQLNHLYISNIDNIIKNYNIHYYILLKIFYIIEWVTKLIIFSL